MMFCPAKKSKFSAAKSTVETWVFTPHVYRLLRCHCGCHYSLYGSQTEQHEQYGKSQTSLLGFFWGWTRVPWCTFCHHLKVFDSFWAFNFWEREALCWLVYWCCRWWYMMIHATRIKSRWLRNDIFGKVAGRSRWTNEPKADSKTLN
jgi:hypothetical protein